MKSNDKNATEDNPKTPVDPKLQDALDEFTQALEAKSNLLPPSKLTALAYAITINDGLKKLRCLSKNKLWNKDLKHKCQAARSTFYLHMKYGEIAVRVGIIPTEENYKAIVAVSKALPENQKQAWEESGAESADCKKILAVIKDKNYGKPSAPSKRVKAMLTLFRGSQDETDYKATKNQVQAELEAIKNDKLGIKVLNTKELEDLYKLMTDKEQS